MAIPSSPHCDSCYNGNSCANRNHGGCSGCNQCNSTCQTLCQVGYQLIKDHPNVGAFPWGEVKGWATHPGAEDMLYKFLTAANWNSLITKINNAESVGSKSSQGSAGTATTVQPQQVFYAKYYNEIQKKLSGFIDGTFPVVKKDDLITAVRINAIRNGFNSAKFKTSVCDTCNNGQVGCACNCSCSCDCSCGCSCSCGPSCSCDCGPSCSANK